MNQSQKDIILEMYGRFPNVSKNRMAFMLFDQYPKIWNNKEHARCAVRHFTGRHGHEMRSRTGGVNPARTTYLYTHKSVLIGHFHRTSLHTEPDLDKKVISCWSTGCLCDLHADYDPYNRWNQGCAIVRTEGEMFEVQNLRRVKNKMVT